MLFSVRRVATFALKYKTSYGAQYADRVRPLTAGESDEATGRLMW